MNVEWWLVRHGLTAWNAERRYQGHSDPPLLPGEASGLAELRRELAGGRFTAVYASDLRRCRETLAWARPDLLDALQRDPRLREMNFGRWEGQTYEMLKDDERYRAWLDDPQAVTPPGGESWEAFKARVSEVCGELLTRTEALTGAAPGSRSRASTQSPELQPRTLLSQPPSPPFSLVDRESLRLLIVTHGGVISMLCSLLQPGLGFWDTRVGPGGVKRLYFQGQGEPGEEKERFDE
ncbi:histidine phosphatase family protein [uncultured Paenibacillus sp.]|uniref:histidine phosphatase family protein n=1 Tax=uncultured Paenibacillus sp. TaxID=227322 RepID=UPI0015A939EE|nr:histidine phosphatase family protein [uncultured Paenibacillus sp.]